MDATSILIRIILPRKFSLHNRDTCALPCGNCDAGCAQTSAAADRR